MDNVIQIENVNKIYGSSIKKQVLYDINLTIKKGEFISIIGQSGSGKSTLLNIIGTLDTPSSGSVKINGNSVESLSKNGLANLRNKTIGFIFQFHYLLNEFSIIENVLMPYSISGEKINKNILNRAEELLKYVGLENRKNDKINMLSGGQQQRVAIARALINNPEIILADEPTGNQDSKTTDEIYSLMKNINEEMNTTFIIITHDQKVAQRMDRIIEISDGRISLDIQAKKG